MSMQKESAIRKLPVVESWVTRPKKFLVDEGCSQPVIKNYCLVARSFFVLLTAGELARIGVPVESPFIPKLCEGNSVVYCLSRPDFGSVRITFCCA